MSNPGTPSKPPLAFTSQRPSPFRRPESPLGRSPSTVRAPTPQGSPLKKSTPSHPCGDLRSSTPVAERSCISHTSVRSPAPPLSKSPIPFELAPSNSERPKDHSKQPVATTRPLLASRTSTSSTIRGTHSDPLSSIPAQHLHTMRESFSVLDRSNNGQITPADVATALAELGLDNSSTTLSTYFPPGTSFFNLGAYLNLLTRDLAHLSRQDELIAAFSAFDDDDSGQIDVAELRDALLTTLPESGQPLTEQEIDTVLDGFTGRRVLRKGQVHSGMGSKKEVFRYGDFTTNIWGGGGNNSGIQQGVPG